jgi:hypothetical protein
MDSLFCPILQGLCLPVSNIFTGMREISGPKKESAGISSTHFHGRRPQRILTGHCSPFAFSENLLPPYFDSVEALSQLEFFAFRQLLSPCTQPLLYLFGEWLLDLTFVALQRLDFYIIGFGDIDTQVDVFVFGCPTPDLIDSVR